MSFGRNGIAVWVIAVGLGCTAPPSPAPKKPEVPRPPERLSAKEENQVARYARSTNTFAFDLYRAAGRDNGHNLLVSPFSVNINLSALLQTTRGRSTGILAKTLLLSVPPEEAPVLAGRLQSMVSRSGEVRTANSLWLIERIALREEYLKAAQESFGTELQQVEGPGPASVAKINDWVSSNTGGRIPTILDHLDSAARVVLVNATTFDAKWQRPFDPAKTQSGHFTLATGKKVTVPFMNATEQFVVHETPGNRGFLAVELPYKTGQFTMLLLLPNRPGTRPSLADYESLIRRKIQREVVLSIPKLKVRDRLSLVQALATLGMGPLFNAIDMTAASPNLTPQDTFINQVAHATFLEVDEQGTRAAAATATEAAGSAYDLTKPLVFRADRPFTLLIRHERSGAILFLGDIANPTQ